MIVDIINEEQLVEIQVLVKAKDQVDDPKQANSDRI